MLTMLVERGFCVAACCRVCCMLTLQACSVLLVPFPTLQLLLGCSQHLFYSGIIQGETDACATQDQEGLCLAIPSNLQRGLPDSTVHSLYIDPQLDAAIAEARKRIDGRYPNKVATECNPNFSSLNKYRDQSNRHGMHVTYKYIAGHL